jgi:hypothetical protein
MALPWVRMETNWASNPKFLMLAEDGRWRAIAVYWAALAWSAAQGQCGFVPHFALTQIFGTRKQAAELVEVGLLDPVEGGWDIHDFAEFQPSHAEHELRRKRAQAAAYVRWHGKNGQTPE